MITPNDLERLLLELDTFATKKSIGEWCDMNEIDPEGILDITQRYVIAILSQETPLAYMFSLFMLGWEAHKQFKGEGVKVGVTEN